MTDLSQKKRIVIKVGSSTLAYPTGRLNLLRIETLIKVLSDLKNSGKDIVFVTSGAVAAGMGVAALALSGPPRSMPEKQACAAIGQRELMTVYDREFTKYGHSIGQILITRDVVSNSERKQNVTNTLNTLLSWGVIPIINANDSVSIEQLDFDENDTLSAMTAKLCGADLLVILTDVDGLYDRNPSLPDAKHLPLVHKITAEMTACAKEKGSDFAKGGMLTKLEAAMLALEDDIDTVILKGDKPENLYDLFRNQAKCTIFTNKGVSL